MNEAFYFHGKTSDNRRFTIAGKYSDMLFTMRLGIAICSTDDLFVKKVGRAKAYGRTMTHGQKGMKIIIMNNDNTVMKQFFNVCSKYNNYTAKDLQKEFGLYHHYDFC